MVLEVEGPVQLIREVRDSTGAPTLEIRPVRVGDPLRTGDRVDPREGATLTVINREGDPEVMGEPVFLEAPAGEPASPLFRRTAAVLARSEPAAATRDGMQPRAGVPTPVDPRSGILITEAQPRLRWLGVDGASGYTVLIRSPGEREARYTTADTSLVLPRALSPGRTYYWSVEADGRAGPETSLRTISDAEATALVEGLAEIRARGFDPDGAGRLLKVALYAELGLLYAALPELLAVEAGAGEAGTHLLGLKARILDGLGRLDEARRTRERARALEAAGRRPSPRPDP